MAEVRKRWSVVELSPSDEIGYDYVRVVALFDTEEDAKHVLKALDEVNVLMHSFIVTQISHIGYDWQKVSFESLKGNLL